MTLVFPLAGNQASAVHPERTVWLSASAGTGKTQVLSARVLRLLLQPDVEPESILCLTFTKAGAAEMAVRVNEVLAAWVRLDDGRLAEQLRAIGAPHTPAVRARARSRFAAVLDCPGGGLRIGTIHAFSQWLLSAFPQEAGLQPGTRAMEDRDRDQLVRKVLADMLLEAEARGDNAFLDALAMLSLRDDYKGVVAFLLRCAAARELWIGPGALQPPLRPTINRALGLEADEDGSGLGDLCADGTFDCFSLRLVRRTLKAWGAKSGRDRVGFIDDWLGATGAARLDGLDALDATLFTQAGKPRDLRFLEKIDSGYQDAIARVRASLETVKERRATLALADLLVPALTLGRAFALAWDEAKAREGFIDFDDQIRSAADLLTRQDMAEWVRYKLDRRFDHILIDEAQDTNSAQWEIIDALIGDFYSGEGQHGDALRTLFVVGDTKQAIFRFQGTSPAHFEAARERVRAALESARDPLDELGLGQSFRTARPVLRFVDAAIDAIGWQRFGLKAPAEPHVGQDRPGMVTLWNTIGGSSEEAEEAEAPDDSEGGEESWLSRPDRMLAETIAKQVRQWLDEGYPLQKGDRTWLAGPGDVMVLVRKRKELAGLIVARLHANGVPVAGVDRLRLGAPLAVRDLMAALRFAVQPNDSLNLACLLVSPLIGWSQEDLLARGYRLPPLTLWEHLRANDPEIVGKLGELLARADYQTPQALLQWLLVGPWQGRARLVERLGAEANDPINELLNAAFAFSSSNVPGLHRFIAWFDSGEGELKREAGRSDGFVRVMTVHGAKGLQAPIVILADAADDPNASPPRDLAIPEPGPREPRREIPLPRLKTAERVGPAAVAYDVGQREDREEHWRLLYVAMTRAEQSLFVAGAQSARRKELAPDSWYAALQPLFDDGEAIADPLWGMRREIGSLPARPTQVFAEREGDRAERPEWLDRPIGPEPRPPRPLAPSSLGEEDSAEPPAMVAPGDEIDPARRGVLIHRLLERLPEVAEGDRPSAAQRWLARTAEDLAEAVRDEIAAAALSVIADPRWAEVLGPESLAEVPLAAVVDGQVITGTVDRLLLTPERIRIIDYKTSRRPPLTLEEVPTAYLRQMAAYARALAVIYPGRPVDAALLYTQSPQLFVLPAELLAAQKVLSSPQQESFAG